MNSVSTTWKKAFTLIEISIVLVIIGLIVGSVLVGQDLIQAAEVRAQLSQIERYNTAVNTFRIKYQGLPGDLALLSANDYGFTTHATCTGGIGGRDGNGLIDGGYIESNKLSALMGENAMIWADLSTARLIDFSHLSPGSCDASQALANPSAIARYLPSAKLGTDTFIHVYEANGYNWFLLAGFSYFTPVDSLARAKPVIPVMQSYNIDKKIDDGIPTTGSVQAISVTTSQSILTPAPNAAADDATTCYNTTGPAYSISYNKGTGRNCALSFRFQ